MEYTDGSRGRFSNSITGFLSQNNGCTYYQGSYHILCVQIKANGLFTIFGIPQRLIQNAVLDLEDLLGNDSNRLTEQCEECNTIDEMAKILDSFFIKKLLARKVRTDTATINALANELFMRKGLVSIDSLKSKSNMSFRTFERQFHEQVGMPPKLFARVSRFFYAVEDKMFHPHKSWTDITYEYEYYDQSHFIKDVIYFSGKSPSELFHYTPPPSEKYIDSEGSLISAL